MQLLPRHFAVCRFAAHATVPQWAGKGPVSSVTRTADELSIVCEARFVPSKVKCQRGWRCFKLQGPFPFEMTGVLASVLAPLARARVSIFALSTYDTDYVMVKEKSRLKAVRVLRAAGHEIKT